MAFRKSAREAGWILALLLLLLGSALHFAGAESNFEKDHNFLSNVSESNHVVLLNLGVNDILTGLPAEATWVANYQTILDAINAKWPAVRVWLMLPWLRGYDADSNAVATRIAAVQASRSSFVSIGPDERVWLKGADDGATMTTDGIHYSTAGKAECAAQWQTALGY